MDDFEVLFSEVITIEDNQTETTLAIYLYFEALCLFFVAISYSYNIVI